MNAELAEGGLGSLWLQQNATIDQVRAWAYNAYHLHVYFLCVRSILHIPSTTCIYASFRY